MERRARQARSRGTCHGGCGRTVPAETDTEINGWNAMYVNGRAQWFTCPDCQTDEDRAEGDRNFEEYGSVADAPTVVEGRVLTTAQLLEAAEWAEREDCIGLDVEKVAEQPPDAPHYCIPAGHMNDAEGTMLVYVMIGLDADWSDGSIRDSSGDEIPRVESFGASEDALGSGAATAGVLTVQMNQWMLWGQRFVAESGWRDVACAAAEDYFAAAGGAA